MDYVIQYLNQYYLENGNLLGFLTFSFKNLLILAIIK